jgi:hypothetical protein
MNTRRWAAAKPKNPRRASVNEVESEASAEDEHSAQTSEEQSQESQPPNRPPPSLPATGADVLQPITARAQTAAIVGEGDDPVVTPPPPQLKTKRDKANIFKKKTAAPIGPRPLESLDLKSLNVAKAQFQRSIKLPLQGDHQSPITVAVKIGSKSYVVKARTVDLSDHVLNTDLIRAVGLSGVTAPATATLTPAASVTLLGKLIGPDVPTPVSDELRRALGPQSPSQISEMASGSTIDQIETSPKNLAAFQKWANSDKGVSALGSMAFVDLLVGMNDRVISKWNGANFMFDSKKGSLSCIDNAKDSTLGLLNNDNQDAAWQSFVTNNLDDAVEGNKETIPEAIARFLYRGDSGTPLGTPTPSGRRPKPVDPDKVAQITQVAHDAFQQVSAELANVALPQAVAARLQARLDFLRPLLDTPPQ